MLTVVLTITILAFLATPGTPLCPKMPSSASEESQSAADGLDFWSERAGRCYRYFPEKRAWFQAEAHCRDFGGHLASISSDEENRLVGRISDCQDTWIGAFSTEFHKATDPATYEWTEDEGKNVARQHHGGYTRLNVSIPGDNGYGKGFDPHMGAVRAAQLAWLNSYYHEDHPYVCEAAASHEAAEECPVPFYHFRGNCYWLSDFASSFVSANLHCQRHMNAHLASVHNHAEARFIATLELDTDSCRMESVWLGLVRQDPCQNVAPGATEMATPKAKSEEGLVEAGGTPRVCFQWTDFSGEPSSVNPGWEGGSPVADDEKVNCVSFSLAGLRNEMCHIRHRFVCKRPTGAADSESAGRPTQAAGRQAGNEAVAMETAESLKPRPSVLSEAAETARVEEPIQLKVE